MKMLEFAQKIEISPLFLLVFGVFFAFFTLFFACFLRKNAAFFACAAAFYLLFTLAANGCRALNLSDKRTLYKCLAALYLLLYAAFLLHLRLVKKRENRRAKFEAARAAKEYILPERGNGYVRDKLRENAVLPPSNEEIYAEKPVELSHAQGLLKRLKKCALSVSDRLETESLEEKIGAFENAPKINAEAARELSECFSAVLKMSAKYML